MYREGVCRRVGQRGEIMTAERRWDREDRYGRASGVWTGPVNSKGRERRVVRGRSSSAEGICRPRQGCVWVIGDLVVEHRKARCSDDRSLTGRWREARGGEVGEGVVIALGEVVEVLVIRKAFRIGNGRVKQRGRGGCVSAGYDRGSGWDSGSGRRATDRVATGVEFGNNGVDLINKLGFISFVALKHPADNLIEEEVGFIT